MPLLQAHRATDIPASGPLTSGGEEGKGRVEATLAEQCGQKQDWPAATHRCPGMRALGGLQNISLFRDSLGHGEEGVS